MKVACIIQARMGSSRLPGKVLRTVGRQTVLTHVLARARRIPGVDLVHVTTTPDPQDDAIVARCRGAGIGWTRGQRPLAGTSGKNDVLAGYVMAADATRADVVIRITSDCPLLDPAVAGEVLRVFLGTPGCGYASNVTPPSWYDGTDVEVFAADVLRAAGQDAAPDQREHVTTWMRQRPGAVNVRTPDGIDYSGLKLSIDEPADLMRVRRVYAALPYRCDESAAATSTVGWRDVIAAYHRAFPPPLLVRALQLYGPRPEASARVRAYLWGTLAALGDQPTVNPSAAGSPEGVAYALGVEDVRVLGHVPGADEVDRLWSFLRTSPGSTAATSAGNGRTSMVNRENAAPA